MNKLRFISKEKPDDNQKHELKTALRGYNRQFAENKLETSLLYSVRDENDQLMGGVYGTIYWEWLHIDLLWVQEKLRGEGIGTKLIRGIEQLANERNVYRYYLSTVSFQAKDFYLKMGYEICGEINDLPPGHDVYYLKKTEV